MTTSKFKPGDKVKIVKYGSLYWESKEERRKMFEAGYITIPIPQNIVSENESHYWLDMNPEIVGQIGTIQGCYGDLYGYASDTDYDENLRRSRQYSITGIRGKSSWYNEDQLELVKYNIYAI